MATELRELIVETKKNFPIMKIVDLLGLQLKYERTPKGEFYRGTCPFCQRERTFRITPAENRYGCFKCGEDGVPHGRGDQLQLIQSVKGLKNVREAIEWLVGGTEQRIAKRPVPPPAVPELDPSHPDIETMGFDPEDAARLGIGYSQKEGAVLIPLRLPDGYLVGYVAAQEVIPLDLNFPEPVPTDPKIVKFPKKTA